MPNDALDPGPNGDFPFWPRTVDGDWDTVRMPTGEIRQKSTVDGRVRLLDVTPRGTDGTPIVPPDLTPPK